MAIVRRLPAISAALIAPIEMPATHSGAKSLATQRLNAPA